MNTIWSVIVLGSLLAFIVYFWGWGIAVLVMGAILFAVAARYFWQKGRVVVPEMKVAVVFSSPGEMFSRFLPPGIHFLVPGVEYVQDFISTGPQAVRSSSYTLTRDGHAIPIDWMLTYRLNPEEIQSDRRANMVRTLPSRSERIAKTQVNDSLRELVEQYNISDLRRVGVQSRLKRDLRQKVALRLTPFGFNVYRIFFEKIFFPPSMIRANEKKYRGAKHQGLSNMESEFEKPAISNLSEVERAFNTQEQELNRDNENVQYYSLFISYSSEDEIFARKLYEDLEYNGVGCWFAPFDIQAGKKIFHQIDSAIKIHDRLLLILSEHSMASEWVKTEIVEAKAMAMEQDRQILFPISIVDYDQIKKWKCIDADTGKDLAKEIREYFIPDFSNWNNEKSYQAALNKLLRDLKAMGSE